MRWSAIARCRLTSPGGALSRSGLCRVHQPHWLDTPAPLRLPFHSRHLAAARRAGKEEPELGTVMDRFHPRPTWLKGWGGWCSSTIALAQLQLAIGFTVPTFKTHAALLFEEVGVALARADEAELARLTTPSCLATMLPALRSRAKGEKHQWISHGVNASIKQIRLGHSSRNRDRKFAQVTCAIEAKMVYEVRDASGKLVGSTGSEAAPHAVTDFWVFERMLAEGGTWRLKERLGSFSELTSSTTTSTLENGTGKPSSPGG